MQSSVSTQKFDSNCLETVRLTWAKVYNTKKDYVC